MVVQLLFVLFCAGVLLSSTEGQNDFSKLPDLYKTGVELALKQVNSHASVQQHFLFFKSLSKSDVDAGFGVMYVYHHFLARATKCLRGTVDADYMKCAFRNDRPLIDCGICYKTFGGQIEEEPKPFIDCVYKPKLTQGIKTSRVQHCSKMSYSSGSASILLVRGSQ
uniref:Retinoic acid receptor responder protein 2 n=1 Tax=Electrophorus electricus TaxID=8005 RepID=A0AAY5F4I8_ELEEL